MKIIVLGGSGYLGSHVVEQLCHAGMSPLCLVRATSDTRYLQHLGVDVQVSDFTDASIAEWMRGADVVINCLARPGLHLSLVEHRKVDVELTVRMMQQAIQAEVSRFIQLSTVQVYGFRRPPKPIDEEYPSSADYPFNQVAIEREQALKTVAKDAVTELIILRPTNAIGARDPNFLQIVKAHKQGVFPLFKKDVVFSCVDARDVGRAMVWLATQKKLQYGCYLLKGFDVSWLQLKEKLDAIAGKRARILFLPERWMLLIGYICEKLFPYGSHPPLTRFAVRVMTTNTLFDSSRIEGEGFTTSYDVDQMLSAYCDSLSQ